MSFDIAYQDRLSFLADLANQNPRKVWRKLSREALKLYPVESEALQRHVLSFRYFEKAAMLGLEKRGII